MRTIAALLLLIGLVLGFSPGSAEASPCPAHSHAHHAAAAQGGDRGAPQAAPLTSSAEAAADAASALSRVPAPGPLSGLVVPEGLVCCHAAPTAAPAAEPDLRAPARTGRRVAFRFSLPVPSSHAFGIYRPPTTT